jgi:hypothetical protein
MPNKLKFSKETLELEYVTNKRTMKEIAVMYHTHQTVVWNSLKRYGIPARKEKRQTEEFKQKSFSSRFKGCGEISGYHICCIKANAKRGGREYALTPEYLWNLFLSQNRQCYFTGLSIGFPPLNQSVRRTDLSTASLDRIDNSKGYVEGNVRWVHKDVNKLRGAFTDEKFISLCTQIAIHQGELS